MRSALWQALDIVGQEVDSERALFLACIIADLMAARFRADRAASPAWRAVWTEGDGRSRVRAALATPEPFFLVDWTEPEAVLLQLGLTPPSRRKGSHGD